MEYPIFERAGSPRELGLGLGLAPNALAALRETFNEGRGSRGRRLVRQD